MTAVTNLADIRSNQIGVQIERGVPLPRNLQHPRNAKYPWKEMAVGDSFAFAADYVANHAYAVARAASKANAPKQFIVRRDADRRMRCWRIA